jgi:hypothetical protein
VAGVPSRPYACGDVKTDKSDSGKNGNSLAEDLRPPPEAALRIDLADLPFQFRDLFLDSSRRQLWILQDSAFRGRSVRFSIAQNKFQHLYSKTLEL